MAIEVHCVSLSRSQLSHVIGSSGNCNARQSQTATEVATEVPGGYRLRSKAGHIVLENLSFYKTKERAEGRLQNGPASNHHLREEVAWYRTSGAIAGGGEGVTHPERLN